MDSYYKSCIWCGTIYCTKGTAFERQERRRFCSHACGREWRAKESRERPIRYCSVCRRDRERECFRIRPDGRPFSFCKDCETVQGRIRPPKRSTRKARPTPPPIEKTKARQAVQAAIRAGRLVRQPCQICGQEKTQAHHPDYSKPLDVEWLCTRHHGMAHWKPVDTPLLEVAINSRSRPSPSLPAGGETHG